MSDTLKTAKADWEAANKENVAAAITALANWANDYGPALIALAEKQQAGAEALAGYRAATAFISSDAWDGCSDCIDVLKSARCADYENSMTLDEIAANLTRIRKHYTPATQPTPPDSERMIGAFSVDIELALKDMGFLVGEANALKLAELSVSTLRQQADKLEAAARELVVEAETGRKGSRATDHDYDLPWEDYTEVPDTHILALKAALEQST